jgi:hypothetical protein
VNCKNCDKTLSISQNFCDECGAKIIRNRLTPKVLLHQINEQFLSIDNKFLRTFIDLFKKPDDVIAGYINGTRKKYIDVLTYYAIALTILGFQMFLLTNFFSEFIDPQNGVLGENFKTINDNPKNPLNNYPDVMNNYQGIVFTILMPFIAVGTWLMYIDKRRHNYTEHLVINLYVTAQTIFFNFVILMSCAIFDIQDFLIASSIATVPVLIYGAFVFKRLYKSTFFNALMRYIVAYIIYIIAFLIVTIVTTIIIIAYLVATGKLNF